MNKRYNKIMPLITFTVFLIGAIHWASPSFALDVYLVAKSYIKQMPDGSNVTMWGYAEDSDKNLGTDGGEIPTSPGPVITIPPGDTSLTIHIRNDLSVSTSIIIPGQPMSLSPEFFTDSKGRKRVRSFTHETGPGATGTYTWNNVKEGSYIYQSGTHVAVQVQMGLYGALKKDYASGEVYKGITYDNEVILFYSEIDPALHNAVAMGTYGTKSYPSTINYRPKYFLINGEPYPDAKPVFDHSITNNETVLIRFMNAGLETHTPTILDAYFSVVSEDGNLYTYPREKYDVFLPAGKTKDVVWNPKAVKRYPVYDKRLRLTNANVFPGGMLAYLEVQPNQIP
ncbi:Multicopper oxidase [Dissulfuribacter thermophilus]|uniref:Multicopper oxidase n=1 Tax=Dissulfuribacter thermophilus TaxID=1156395 RepID=A0A1B9F2X0_9BACT|nr:multicopper oxidase domain-containing protein [Dissulfuribacter thermophilus]OCC14277.1 Multicopper oxidase [Dissulfuribacter thermophilus]